MSKAVAWPIVWLLFWMGHVWSRAILRFDSLGFTYPVYNKLMCASADIQDWSQMSGGPWTRAENDNG